MIIFQFLWNFSTLKLSLECTVLFYTLLLTITILKLFSLNFYLLGQNEWPAGITGHVREIGMSGKPSYNIYIQN